MPCVRLEDLYRPSRRFLSGERTCRIGNRKIKPLLICPKKKNLQKKLEEFVTEFKEHISTDDGQWTIKGFIDIFKNVYTISSDTKIVSKILEIHLFPKILQFAQTNGYKVVLADHQNYYPDRSFVKASLLQKNEK